MKRSIPPRSPEQWAKETFDEISVWMDAQTPAPVGAVSVPVQSFPGRAQAPLLELLKPWGWRFDPQLSILIEGPLRLIPIVEAEECDT